MVLKGSVGTVCMVVYLKRYLNKNDIMTLNDRITLVEGRTRKQCNSNGDRYTGEYPGPHTLQGFRYASAF